MRGFFPGRLPGPIPVSAWLNGSEQLCKAALIKGAKTFLEPFRNISVPSWNVLYPANLCPPLNIGVSGGQREGSRIALLVAVRFLFDTLI